MWLKGREMERKTGWMILSCLMAVALLMASCAPAITEEEEAATSAPEETRTSTATLTREELKVHFIDVGQGDSILVDLGEIEILIDSGGKSPGVTAYLNDYVDGQLEVMVATHPHADHIGGLIAVLDAFDVQEIWHNEDTSTSQTYGQFMTAVQAEGAEVHVANRGDEIVVDGLTFVVLNPTTLAGTTNNNSIVLRLSYGETDFLFTGDAEREAEASMLSAGIVPDVEILKVGHHGSRTASSQFFVAMAQPEVAVYMAGEGNSYGHPHDETITALSEIGAEIYGTDIHGTIIITTDGESYTIHLEEEVAPLAPTPTETHGLGVSVSPPDSGSISPSGGDFASGTEVAITAEPSLGYAFMRWGGDASGNSPTITITMNSDKDVIAYFEKVAVTYNLTITVNGQGTTVLSPGTYTYDEGTQVTVTASPASNWRFNHWSGDASGNSPTVVITMDSNKNIAAYFEEVTTAGSNVQITRIFYDGLIYRTESDEYVEITNLGTEPQNLAGWVLKDIDEGYPSFTFPSYILEPEASIRVYTNEIHAEWGGFSFGSGKAVWNNKSPDTAALFNTQGQEVSRKSY